MTRELRPYESAIAKAQEDFSRSAQGGLDFDKEKIFAIQQLTKTDYAAQVANANPLSVRLAMLNLAATGLTLNPAHHYAYLVPRKPSKDRPAAIVLDISYIGLLKIATDCGAIQWGRADIVRERDAFAYHGPAKEPQHACNPFEDRGEIVGAYCIAKTNGGDILCDVLTRLDIETIRAKSDLYARTKSGPWEEFFGEMCKKACIKRAQKTWPRSDRVNRLLDAIEIANASEGGYTLDAEPVATVTPLQAETLSLRIVADGIDESEFLAVFNVDSVEALPAFRFAEAFAYLRGRGCGVGPDTGVKNAHA